MFCSSGPVCCACDPNYFQNLFLSTQVQGLLPRCLQNIFSSDLSGTSHYETCVLVRIIFKLRCIGVTSIHAFCRCFPLFFCWFYNFFSGEQIGHRWKSFGPTRSIPKPRTKPRVQIKCPLNSTPSSNLLICLPFLSYWIQFYISQKVSKSAAKLSATVKDRRNA